MINQNSNKTIRAYKKKFVYFKLLFFSSKGSRFIRNRIQFSLKFQFEYDTAFTN